VADFAGQPEVIHTFVEPYRAGDGQLYAVSVVARERADGTWIGWLQFADASGRVRSTERETTQSSAEQVKYWAEGLQLTYFDGAFERASRA
jgi:hypothetical protein